MSSKVLIVFIFCLAKVGADPGSVCKIVAPLSPGNASFLQQTMQVVSDFGLTPSMSLDIYNLTGPDEGAAWYSNSDEYRAQDLASAILDNNVEIIWFINGGSGAYRTLEFLDKLLPNPPVPLPRPKPVIGFSAATPIFTYLIQKYDWPVIHGALLDLMAIGYYENSTDVTVEPLKRLLLDRTPNITITGLTMVGQDEPPFEGNITGRIVGGSLRQTLLSVGTLYALNTEDKIVFFELLDYSADSVNDLVDAAVFAGLFDKAKAVIFGDFTAEVAEKERVMWTFNRLASEGKVTCPVFKVSGLGHLTTNHPLPLNTNAVLEKDDDGGGNTFKLTVDNVW